MKNQTLPSSTKEEQKEIVCKCGKDFTWSEVKALKGEPVTGMLQALTHFKPSEAYRITCPRCDRSFIAGEIPEACIHDENGFSAPAYLTITWSGRGEAP